MNSILIHRSYSLDPIFLFFLAAKIIRPKFCLGLNRISVTPFPIDSSSRNRWPFRFRHSNHQPNSGCWNQSGRRCFNSTWPRVIVLGPRGVWAVLELEYLLHIGCKACLYVPGGLCHNAPNALSELEPGLWQLQATVFNDLVKAVIALRIGKC